MTDVKLTKAQTIARDLATDIASGRFAPGTALDETAIAAHYGVSRTPIREAIRQLTASGVIEVKAHRGAVVRAFDERQLDDMFAVMADLEGLCARGAALAMTGTEVAGLEDLLHHSAGAVATADTAAYVALNERFHAAIYLGAHNPYLMQLTFETQRRLVPFRQAQFSGDGRLARSLTEHRHVAEAIRRRDAAAAFDAMRAHIVHVRSAVDRLSQRGAGPMHTN